MNSRYTAGSSLSFLLYLVRLGRLQLLAPHSRQHGFDLHIDFSSRTEVQRFTPRSTMRALHLRVSTGPESLQPLVGHTADTCHMLVADDYHPEAGGPGYRGALLVFPRLVLYPHGTKRRVETRLCGSASTFSVEADCSESLRTGPTCSHAGRGKLRSQTPRRTTEFERLCRGAQHQHLTLHPRTAVPQLSLSPSQQEPLRRHTILRSRHALTRKRARAGHAVWLVSTEHRCFQAFTKGPARARRTEECGISANGPLER